MSRRSVLQQRERFHRFEGTRIQQAEWGRWAPHARRIAGGGAFHDDNPPLPRLQWGGLQPLAARKRLRRGPAALLQLNECVNSWGEGSSGASLPPKVRGSEGSKWPTPSPLSGCPPPPTLGAQNPPFTSSCAENSYLARPPLPSPEGGLGSAFEGPRPKANTAAWLREEDGANVPTWPARTN